MTNTPPPAHEFDCNRRAYAAPWRSDVRAAVICLDGSADEYIDAALLHGLMPTLARFCREHGRFRARAAMPTFTNPNNASIITGLPPSLHGIAGNFFIDPATGRETMMNNAEFLRAQTIPAAAHSAGARVAVATAKDKLRSILSKGLSSGEQGVISISAERAAEASRATHGVGDALDLAGAAAAPAIYSAQASLFVLRFGVGVFRHGLADIAYLSTTDYIQHKHAPDEPEALEFYAAIDRELAELDRLGVMLAITADHGMNAKEQADGTPNVLFLEPILREVDPGVRVILPITDPYVAHHGSLGSFAVVHASTAGAVDGLKRRLVELTGSPLLADRGDETAGLTEVLHKADACRLLELPEDRTGDLVVCAGRNTVIGRSPEHHDLAALHGRLRSHGGRYEEMVPLIFNRPLLSDYARRAVADPRNFDAFDFLLNGLHNQGAGT